MKFKAGDKMLWKSTGLPAYEKLDNEDFGWWVSLDSNFLVEKQVWNKKPVLSFTDYEVLPESEKPLYKDGKLNRYGFKLDDQGVYEYYKDIMTFELTN